MEPARIPPRLSGMVTLLRNIERARPRYPCRLLDVGVNRLDCRKGGEDGVWSVQPRVEDDQAVDRVIDADAAPGEGFKRLACPSGVGKDDEKTKAANEGKNHQGHQGHDAHEVVAALSPPQDERKWNRDRNRGGGRRRSKEDGQADHVPVFCGAQDLRILSEGIPGAIGTFKTHTEREQQPDTERRR